MNTTELRLIGELTQTRVNRPRSKHLHTIVQTFTDLVREQHSAASYLITILFPETDVLDSWSNLDFHLKKLKELFEGIQTCYAVIGIEMHRSGHKKSKASKRGRVRPRVKKVSQSEAGVKLLVSSDTSSYSDVIGKDPVTSEKATASPKTNSMRGTSHLHVFLTVYNDFLGPSKAELTSQLLSLGFLDIDVQRVFYGTAKNPKFDAKRSFLYCVKEGKDQNFVNFVNTYANRTTTVVLLCGLAAVLPQLISIRGVLARNGIESEFCTLQLQNELPSVSLSDNRKVQITEFFGKLMCMANLRLCANTDTLLAKDGLAKWTYVDTRMTVSTAYTSIWKRLPPLTSMLQTSARWVLADLSGFQLELLPTVYPDPQQIELSDGVYDFQVGLYQASMQRMPRPESSCCTYWPSEKFEQLTFPSATIEFLHGFCNRPVMDFCMAFGALFHEHSRPIPKPIFVYGNTGSGKTTLLDTVLSDLLSEDHIGRLSSHASRFQLADLVNCWVAILNDFTLADFQHTTFMNLLEGNPVFIENKYKRAIKRSLPRTVITSNSDPNQAVNFKTSLAPLMRRLNVFEFRQPVGQSDSQRSHFMNTIRREGLGFAVLCNTVYLSNRNLSGRTKVSVPTSWRLKGRSENGLTFFENGLTL